MDTILETVQAHTYIKLCLAFDESPTTENVVLMMLCIYGLTNGSVQQRKYDKFIFNLSKLSVYISKKTTCIIVSVLQTRTIDFITNKQI